MGICLALRQAPAHMVLPVEEGAAEAIHPRWAGSAAEVRCPHTTMIDRDKISNEPCTGSVPSSTVISARGVRLF